MNITILAIGKLKEKYFKQACDEYLKRMSPYAKVNVLELKAVSFTEKSREKCKKDEGEKILAYLEKQSDCQVIVLDECGKNYTSLDFSDILAQVNVKIVFVIGGSLGLDKRVIARADLLLSLSKMTFPHEMVRVFLCEQIYRAITIKIGKTYHY